MRMGKSCSLVIFMFLLMINPCLSFTKCKRHELEALINFKRSFTKDPQRVLSSWVGEDCCQWRGVGCDSVTSDVIKLNLPNLQAESGDYTNSLVSPKLSPALLELKFLSHLDLSFNNFNGSQIPTFLEFMTKLRYLSLAGALFSGPVPPQIGNLTNLIHLDLSGVEDQGRYVVCLEWANSLSKLQTLYMSHIDMSQAYDTLQVLFKLPSLLVLGLSSCSLNNAHLSELLITNTSTLQYLDLGANNFEGSFPSLLTNMIHLEYLDLDSNKLNGSLPSQLGQLTNLKYLDLSNNEFQGHIPASIEQLSSLKHITLSTNKLTGSVQDIFEHFRHLTEIEHLSIAKNFIQGSLSHIGNLSKLSHLNMHGNHIKLNLSTNWRPTFQLQFLGFYSCEINTAFPSWLRNQTQIRLLDLSYTGISGELPHWLWNFTNLGNLYLAGNRITGYLPHHITCDGCNLEWLELQNNMLSGTVPHWLKHLGTIEVVDLSENWLSGGVFEGENASSLLSGINSLEFLDLSDNMFSGEIHVTNPQRGDYLVFLSLRGNDFSGPIGSQFCHFTYLAVLDLSHNRLTGHIPRCLGSMKFKSDRIVDNGTVFVTAREMIKGTTEYLSGTLHAYTMIDLSCNSLVGIIPKELTNISNLMQLNLSNNHLTGDIPNDIGNLKLLESLDLSNNNLSGTIPQSLSTIQWLSVLNLSYNHLYGPIPTGNQLQTLDDSSIYAGNSGLCGFPLPNKCSNPNSSLNLSNDDHGAEKGDGAKDKLDKLWLYLAVMSGVATGFWSVVLTLVFKKSWRHAYFRFVEKVGDKIYVPLKVKMNRFKRA